MDWVLFDLGGVLVQVDGVAGMQRLWGLDDESEVWRRWLSCEWVRRYESGRCTTEEFVTGLVAEWALPLSAEAFLAEFVGWPARLYKGAADLVADTSRHVKVGCLSNSNSVHWERQAQLGLADMFDARFLSHEMGLIKPDREVFDHVMSRLGSPPERVLFLDDNEINVVAASNAGLRAAVAHGVDGARSVLQTAGLLDASSGPPLADH